MEEVFTLSSSTLCTRRNVTARSEPRWLSPKESACDAGDARDPGLIPGSGRSSGAGNGNPLQSSCLENPMDRGAWWAIVHGVAKSWTWLSVHAHTHRVSPDVSETSEMPCHLIWDEMSRRPGCLDATPASRFGIYSSSCWVLRISSWVFHPQWRRVKVFNSDLLVYRAQFTIWRVQFILKIFTYGNT